MRTAKWIAAILLFAGYLLIGTGCVTVGYDLLNKRVTVTVDPTTKGFKK